MPLTLPTLFVTTDWLSPKNITDLLIGTAMYRNVNRRSMICSVAVHAGTNSDPYVDVSTMFCFLQSSFGLCESLHEQTWWLGVSIRWCLFSLSLLLAKSVRGAKIIRMGSFFDVLVQTSEHYVREQAVQCFYRTVPSLFWTSKNRMRQEGRDAHLQLSHHNFIPVRNT